jgi:hypothetical protein
MVSASVFRYLLNRENHEDSPYYKGRYLVALNTVRNAERGLCLPYEAAEVIFQDTRYARTIQAWLEHRQEQFKNWNIRADGTVAGIRIHLCVDAQILPPKKPPASIRVFPKRIPAERLRIVFAEAAFG